MTVLFQTILVVGQINFADLHYIADHVLALTDHMLRTAAIKGRNKINTLFRLDVQVLIIVPCFCAAYYNTYDKPVLNQNCLKTIHVSFLMLVKFLLVPGVGKWTTA